MPVPPRLVALLAGLLLAAALPAGTARAERASESAVKAGFVFNFIRYTDWPAAEAAEGPLKICMLGRAALGGQLLLLQGRQLHNREVAVRLNVRKDEWRQCQVLFLAEEEGEQVDQVLSTVAGAPVLTIGDLPGFAQAGGMIGLRTVDSRVRFDVNLAVSQRSGLRMHSQMLKLAGEVFR